MNKAMNKQLVRKLRGRGVRVIKGNPDRFFIRKKTGRLKAAKIGGGVVSCCVRGPGAGGKSLATAALLEVLHAGLPVQELIDLQASLQVPMDRLIPILGISKATFHRRKLVGRLDRAESDRVVRFARMMGRAVEVMESEAAARQWLLAPQHGLGGAVPLEYAETEVGAREVEDLLGRIEYGVYS